VTEPARAILFDYDDTLVRTRQCKYAALRAVASRHYGFELSASELDRHWGVAYRALFQALFGGVESDLERAIRFYEALDGEFAITAYPETQRVLGALLERGPVGIVTAAGRSIALGQMERLGFPLARLAMVQTAEDTPFHKPDPRVFEPAIAAVERLGVGRDGITYVGDSLADFEASRGAGLAFVGVLRGTTSAEAFALAGATVVESLDELLERRWVTSAASSR
jgi:phosphoglycolate phosphatase-like HAD superfamily hydrolase